MIVEVCQQLINKMMKSGAFLGVGKPIGEDEGGVVHHFHVKRSD